MDGESVVVAVSEVILRWVTSSVGVSLGMQGVLDKQHPLPNEHPTGLPNSMGKPKKTRGITTGLMA